MKCKNIIWYGLLSSILFLGASCSKDKEEKPQPQEPNQAIVISSLAADPAMRDPDDGSSVIDGDNTFTFFSFSDSTIVPNTDSASTKWDIGFRGTEIILNGGVSGPGNITGQVIKGLFETIEKAPADHYKTDQAGGTVFSNWYNYNATSHIISPIPGYILIIHTHDNKYVKMEILNYYKDAPASPTSEDVSRYYTFRYVIQPDGSKNFKP